jgi:hypothetical protein
MGFFSSLVDFADPFDLLGRRSAKDAKDASKDQLEATKEAREQLERLNAPFIDIGTSAIPGLQTFIDDPSGASFLEGNPLFNAAVERTGDQLINNSASKGKFGSGGLVNELFQNYLALGDDFVNSGFQRAFEPVRLGQNAANFQGTSASDLITQGANAQAAGVIGSNNIKAQGAENAIGVAALLSSFSDIRLKENIQYLEMDSDGIPIYEFNYRGGSDRYRGKMAQDLQKVYPSEVGTHESGYLVVSRRHSPEVVCP